MDPQGAISHGTLIITAAIRSNALFGALKHDSIAETIPAEDDGRRNYVSEKKSSFIRYAIYMCTRVLRLTIHTLFLKDFWIDLENDKIFYRESIKNYYLGSCESCVTFEYFRLQKSIFSGILSKLNIDRSSKKKKNGRIGNIVRWKLETFCSSNVCFKIGGMKQSGIL